MPFETGVYTEEAQMKELIWKLSWGGREEGSSARIEEAEDEKDSNMGGTGLRSPGGQKK